MEDYCDTFVNLEDESLNPFSSTKSDLYRKYAGRPGGYLMVHGMYWLYTGTGADVASRLNEQLTGNSEVIHRLTHEDLKANGLLRKRGEPEERWKRQVYNPLWYRYQKYLLGTNCRVKILADVEGWRLRYAIESYLVFTLAPILNKCQGLSGRELADWEQRLRTYVNENGGWLSGVAISSLLEASPEPTAC